MGDAALGPAEDKGRRIPHAHAKLLFSKARDGEADDGELAQLREHLESCPECAGRIEKMRVFYMEIEDVLYPE